MFLRSILLGAAAGGADCGSGLGPGRPSNRSSPATSWRRRTSASWSQINASGFTALDEGRHLRRRHPARTTRRRPLDGTVRGTFPAPFVDADQRDFTCGSPSRATPTNTISAFSKVTTLLGRPRRRSRPTPTTRCASRAAASCWPRTSARTTSSTASPARRCRSPTRRAPAAPSTVGAQQFPFKKRPARGSWTIQFDQLPYYDPLAQTKVPDDHQGQAGAESDLGLADARAGEAQVAVLRRRPRCGPRRRTRP